ncbi:type-F conjugative transfer system pilin assembly protein TraF [Gilliamella sp. BG7]|uniref:type-F conjugative transfer system pilin assembly protein TraF n=1 Tax=unclassified Gilliamella TaxID=2685620 RepID=UPI0039889761
MKKIIVFCCLIFTLIFNEAFAKEVYPYPDESKGFHWYNDPFEIEEDKKTDKSSKVITKENAEKVIEALRRDLDKAKALAILIPTTENIAEYRKYQDLMTELSSNFASQWKRTLLEYPEFDYNLRFSHYNNVASITAKRDQQQRFSAILELTKKYGLFFFYRGENELDQQFTGVVRQFSTTYNIPIVAISIDKKMSPYFPLTKANKGIVEKLNIKYFPAILLIEPREKKVKPLSYGFMSLTDLEKRFLDVSTNFEPNF